MEDCIVPRSHPPPAACSPPPPLPPFLLLVHWKETNALAMSITLLDCCGGLHCSRDFLFLLLLLLLFLLLFLLHLLIFLLLFFLHLLVYWKKTIALAHEYNSAALLQKDCIVVQISPPLALILFLHLLLLLLRVLTRRMCTYLNSLHPNGAKPSSKGLARTLLLLLLPILVHWKETIVLAHKYNSAALLWKIAL